MPIHLHNSFMRIAKEVARTIRSAPVLLQEARVQIFHGIDAITGHERIQMFKRVNDVIHMVTAVVQHNVKDFRS